MFGGGSLTNEKAYWLGKFARVALGHCEHRLQRPLLHVVGGRGRRAKRSASIAVCRFRSPTSRTRTSILLVGSNVAETMPPVMRYFEAQQRNGGKLIVVDPRRTPTAQWATTHLQLRPGSDLALANGLLHVLIREQSDRRDVHPPTDRGVRRGAAHLRRLLARTGRAHDRRSRSRARRRRAPARGRPTRAMILTARGPEQQAQGVNNTLGYINVALALGAVGRPFSGFGTLTGQGNGQGGREHGQKADQLPGYRRIDDPIGAATCRRRLGRARPRRSLGRVCRRSRCFDSIGRTGGVRAMLVMGSNIVVSAPDAAQVGSPSQGARLPGRLRLLPLGNRQPRRRRAAVRAVGGRRRHDDEPRGPRDSSSCARCAPPAGVRTDLGCAGRARGRARQAGASFRPAAAEEVFAELGRASAGGPADYSGITYARIDEEDGVFWPCPGADHPGTPRLFADRFPTPSGRARFHAAPHRRQPTSGTRTIRCYLTTGRVLAQYQSGTQTRHVDALQDVCREPLAEMHPSTAKLHRLVDRGRVAAHHRGAARRRSRCG